MLISVRASTTMLLLVALVAGCGDASGDRRAAPRPAVGYPFGGAAHVPGEERAIHIAAENVLIAACMRERGFQFLPQPGPPGGSDPDNPYGLLTPDDARTHGYRIAEDMMRRPPTVDEDPNEAARAALPAPRRAAYDAALLGTEQHEEEIPVPGGGVFTYRSDACAYTARRALFGADWDGLYVTVQAATNAVVDEVLRSAPFTRAQRDWSSCMGGRGHRASGLADPRRQVAQALAGTGAAGPSDAPTASPTASAAPLSRRAMRLEQRVAVADAACQDHSGLWAVAAVAQEAAEARQPAATLRAADRLRAARATALAAARRLLTAR